MIRAAAYIRVSTEGQDFENQRPIVESFCKQQDWQLTAVYAEKASSWTANHQRELAQLQDDLETGRRKFDRLVIVSLDRLTRQGPGMFIRYMDTFKHLGCQIVSVREPWTDSPMNEVMYLFIAWFARWESDSRSARTKAGQAKMLKAGVSSKGRKVTQLGRPKGSKDKGKRSSTGYLLRYANKKQKRDRQTEAVGATNG